MADIKLPIKTTLEGIEVSTKQIANFTLTASNGIDAIEQSIKGISNSVSFFGSNVSKSALAFTAFNQGIELAKKLASAFTAPVHAAAEAEKAVLSLNETLQSTGQYSAKTSKELQKFASALGRTTKFTSDQILESQALLGQLVKLDKNGLKNASSAAADLAVFLGQDLNNATRLLGGAIKDGTISLRGVSFAFQKGKTDAETFANVLKGVNAEIGGRASSDAMTFGGMLNNLGKAFGNITKEIGKFVTESSGVRSFLNSAIGLVFDFADSLGEMRDFLKENAVIVTSVIEGIARFAVAVGAAILTVTYFGSAISAIGSALSLIPALLAAVTTGLTATRVAAIATSVALTALKAVATLGLAVVFDLLVTKALEFSETVGGIAGVAKYVGQTIKAFIGESIAFGAEKIASLITSMAKIPFLGERFNLKGIAESLNDTADGARALASEAEKARSSLIRIPEGLAKLQEKFKSGAMERIDILAKEKQEMLAQAEAFAEQDARLFETVAKVKSNIAAKYDAEILAERTKKTKEARDTEMKEFEAQRARISALASADVNKIITEITLKPQLSTIETGALTTSIIQTLTEGAKGAQKVISGALGMVGDALLPGIGGAVASMVDFLASGAENIKTQVEGFITAIPEVLNSIISGAGQLVISLIEQLGPLITDLLITIPDILIAAASAFVEKIPEAVNSFISSIPTILTKLAEQLPTLISKLVTFLVSAMPQIVISFVDSLISNGPAILMSLGKAMAAGFINIFLSTWEGIINGFIKILNKIPGVEIAEVSLPRVALAKGGEIPKGFNNDSFQASLSSGEIVVPRGTVDRLESFLESSPQLENRLSRIESQMLSSSRPLTISLQVGESELANVILELNRQGFRTA